MTHALKSLGLLLLTITIAASAHAQTATVLPSSPRYMEPVYVRFTPGGTGIHPFGAQVTMDGNTLTVKYQFVVEVGSGPPMDVMLGHLPTGTYTVKVMRADSVESTAQFSVSALPVPANPNDPNTAAPAVNYSDIWWNPAESGWGMSVHQGATNQLFAIWYVYDASGNPTWYTLEPGFWEGSSLYSGVVYKSSGPYFGGAFDPARVTQVQAGTATLLFIDSGHADFTYTIDGVKGSKMIEREPIE